MTDITAREVTDEDRGRLRVLDPLPFLAKRMFVISDVPPFMKRGEHAHRTGSQVISCVAGSFYVLLRWADGTTKGTRLDANGTVSVYVPPMTWIDVCNFSMDAVCVVMASDSYNPADMITSYETYMRESLKQRSATSDSVG